MMGPRRNIVSYDRPPDMSVFKDNAIRYVFVYGTLKKGHNRNQSLAACKFICEDKLTGYLFDLGGYPAFVPGHNGMQVHGEVYALPDEMDGRKPVLQLLDGIEGTPELYYRYAFRTMKGYYAWAYWMPRDRIQDDWAIITDGKWMGSGKNMIQKWKDFVADDEATGYGFPTKVNSRFDSISKAPACDMYMSSNADRPYAEVSVASTETLAYIPFSVPKATAVATRTIGGVPVVSNLKTELAHFFETKKTKTPEDSVEVAPMVELVWLHGKEEKPEVASQQETGGI